MDRSSTQNINKETQVLNDTLDDMDLIDIFRTFHPNAEYTFFSSAYGTFSRTGTFSTFQHSPSSHLGSQIKPQ